MGEELLQHVSSLSGSPSLIFWSCMLRHLWQIRTFAWHRSLHHLSWLSLVRNVYFVGAASCSSKLPQFPRRLSVACTVVLGSSCQGSVAFPRQFLNRFKKLPRRRNGTGQAMLEIAPNRRDGICAIASNRPMSQLKRTDFTGEFPTCRVSTQFTGEKTE